jgi:hypothetical protein
VTNPLALKLRAHLGRLTIWSVVSLLIGAALIYAAQDEWVRGFGWLTAGWAAVNLVIALLGLRGKPPTERPKFREFLFLNQGLNVGYMMAGAALFFGAGEPFLRGAGLAVVIQGLGLFVLDGLLVRLTRAD